MSVHGCISSPCPVCRPETATPGFQRDTGIILCDCATHVAAHPPTPTAEVDGEGEGLAGLAAVIDSEAFEDDWYDDVETARDTARKILASDWLKARERAAAAEALREAADDMVWDFTDHPVTRSAVREWLHEQAARADRLTR